MPFVELERSALVPDLARARVYYREYGSGFPLLFLHGGWGYQVYPFDRQIAALQSEFHIIIPDRSGYGRSTRLKQFAVPLHWAGAQETLAFLDALQIGRCVLWGHSDGAVMAANAALQAPERIAAVILEAMHYDRHKTRSRAFFTAMMNDPVRFGERIAQVLTKDHGPDYWPQILQMGGRIWLEIMDHADRPEGDLYGGRLSELAVPALVLHGAEDPRTEPGELVAIKRLLPAASMHIIAQARHSPHSERASADECTRVARQFLAELELRSNDG